ncbi:HAD family hydrolase [Candidatus Nomurabacteria bacterium]|nr:HAD family hydrolase [Candidatus Nomurabacteria bacterium]
MVRNDGGGDFRITTIQLKTIQHKENTVEIIKRLPKKRKQIKAALFDFDGKISTLRYGWESVMEPLMLEMITGGGPADDELVSEVRDYIDQSTGIQTYYQMLWLAETVKRYGRNRSASEDPWWYKAEYNRRLMEIVEKRKRFLLQKDKTNTDFLMKGAEGFLKELNNKSIAIYVASGTDDPDVKKEAEVLGLTGYFKEIAGAPPGKADCSKEAVLRRLVDDHGLTGSEVVVIGDGKVEIALGRQVGAVTLGIASDEVMRCGVDNVKRARLIKAGAHAIVGDFERSEEIFDWLGL